MSISLSHFTLKAEEALLKAQQMAAEGRQAKVEPEHLLLSLLEQNDPMIEFCLDKLQIENGVLQQKLQLQIRDFPKDQENSAQTFISRSLHGIILSAEKEATLLNETYTNVDHLLLGLLNFHEGFLGEIWNSLDATADHLRRELSGLSKAEQIIVQGSKLSESAIEDYCLDLVAMARLGELDPVIGMEEEIRNLIQVLSRRTKNNPVLLGEAGVGKTAIVECLAQRIVRGDVPEWLKDRRLVSLDLATMIAGTTYRGEFEKRMKQLIREVEESRGRILLFVDELHMLVGAGGAEGSVDAANMLKPALTKGDLKVVASTTWEEYRKFFEKDRALMRRFQRVTVDEPSPEVTHDILMGIKKYYETHHQAVITEEAIKEAIKLSVKYQSDKKLPDKAIDLIDVACSRFNLKEKDIDRVIGVEEIQYELAKIIKMPEEQVAEKETDNLKNLEHNLKNSVYGQDEAIEGIVDKILVAQAGLKDENKPIGSFVFMGPTGVGKTETAKQLAKHLGVELVRFDMSEYQEKHTIAKLIGSPPGYVGHEDTSGILIEKLQEHPNCVLLLDEVEKAHPDVSQILLQVMDNGKVTSSNGKEADARNCVLILTTNLGAKETDTNAIGFDDLEKETYEDDAFKRYFAPEFRNRLDGVVTFGKLGKEVMMKIVGKFLLELKQMVVKKNIAVKLSDEALDLLVDKGFDRKMGARPLQRVIDKDIKRPLSREMLFGKLKEGGTVTISAKDNEIVLDVETKENAVEAS